ncbi:hypothetical protein D7Y39_11310 [Stenotrophomonas maltophilia]|nr:hypothetical protein [Stenotrophomonas maltophilia]
MIHNGTPAGFFRGIDAVIDAVAAEKGTEGIKSQATWLYGSPLGNGDRAVGTQGVDPTDQLLASPTGTASAQSAEPLAT